MATSAPLLSCPRKIDMNIRSFIFIALMMSLVACGKKDAPSSNVPPLADQTENAIGGNATINNSGNDDRAAEITREETRANAAPMAVKIVSAVSEKEDVDLARSSARSSATETAAAPLPNENGAPAVIAAAALQIETGSAQKTSPTSQPSEQQPPNTPDSPSAPTSQPTPFVHRYPFTPEEEQYRLWYGWNSIDGFRAAKANEH
jgi:hypothetical protein